MNKETTMSERFDEKFNNDGFVLDYETAKKLKDAEFPQYPSLDRETRKVIDTPYVPTLSELIKECGAGFLSLDRSFNSSPNNWIARGNNIKCQGKTLEEAVANLWLALNRK